MKITKLLAYAIFFSVTFINAQEIANHTIGLRLGDSDGFGAEISYQKSIGRYGRAEFNLGYRDSREYDAFKAVLLFQSIYNISGGLNWYYGWGGGAGTVNFESQPNIDDPTIIEEPEDGLFILGAGDIGIEYNFERLPLLISLDIRPEIGIVGYGGFDDRFDFDVGLGVRYQF